MKAFTKLFKEHWPTVLFLILAISLSFLVLPSLPVPTPTPTPTGIYLLLLQPSDLDDGWSEGVYYISHYEEDPDYEYRFVNSVSARVSPLQVPDPWSGRRSSSSSTELWAIQLVREHVTIEEAERSFSERKEQSYPDFVLDRSFFEVDTQLESSVQACRQTIGFSSVYCQALLQYGPYTVDLYITVDSRYITSGDWVDVVNAAEERLLTYGP